MSANIFTYERGAELPSLTLPWQEETAQDTWTDLDLSGGTHTFTLTLVDRSGTTVLTKTSGITGNNGSVSVVWAVDELDIAEGTYKMFLRARETATTKDRDYRPGNPLHVKIV